MEPGGSMPVLSRINPIPRIRTNFFKTHYNKILKALLPSSILATSRVRLNLVDLITLTIIR